jgi:hypothetical protein
MSDTTIRLNTRQHTHSHTHTHTHSLTHSLTWSRPWSRGAACEPRRGTALHNTSQHTSKPHVIHYHSTISEQVVQWTTPHYRTTVLLHYFTTLHYCTTALMYHTALLHHTTVPHCTTAPHHCTTLHYCTTLPYCLTALLHYCTHPCRPRTSAPCPCRRCCTRVW